jgi:two-component system, NarL family, response regulator NreC
MLTLVLADDHQVVRQALHTLLETALPCRVLGQASDGHEAVRLVAQLRPEVLVVDMMMPGLGGLEVIRQVVQIAPATRIVVLSMHADELYVREALRAGASAYVLKEAPAEEFVQAVREVSGGRRYLSLALAERAIDAYLQQTPAGGFDLYQTLTPRERDVLSLLAQGLASAEIAAELGLGVRTIETHRSNIMRKLGLGTQMDLLRFAVRRGIITLE